MVMREAAALGMRGCPISVRMSAGSGLTRLDDRPDLRGPFHRLPERVSALLSQSTTLAADDRSLQARGSAPGTWLPGLVQAWICWPPIGLTEAGCGLGLCALKTRAVRDGEDYVVNGVKQFISGAGTSDLYFPTMVAHRTPRGRAGSRR